MGNTSLSNNKDNRRGSDATPLPVDEEILGQPFGADDLEDDLVGLQGLEVHAAGQGRVQALGQTLPDDQPLGKQRVAQVALQRLERRGEDTSERPGARQRGLEHVREAWAGTALGLFRAG